MNKLIEKLTSKTSITLVFIAVFLIIGLGGYFFYRSFVSPKFTSLQIAKRGVDWFSSLRPEQTPFNLIALPTYICDFNNVCKLHSTDFNPHRRVIAALWSENILYQVTRDDKYLKTLESDITDLNVALLPNESNRFIWQTNFYHCNLINDILTSNNDLSEPSRNKLTQFCLDSDNENIISFYEDYPDKNNLGLPTNLTAKINDLSSANIGSNYDWSTEPKVASLSAELMQPDDLLLQIIYLDDWTTKTKIAAANNGTSNISATKEFEIHQLLDIALASYYMSKTDFSRYSDPITYDLALLAALKNYASVSNFTNPQDVGPLIKKLETNLASSYQQQDLIKRYLVPNNSGLNSLYYFGLNYYLAERLNYPTKELVTTLREFYPDKHNTRTPAQPKAFAMATNEIDQKITYDLQDNSMIFGLLAKENLAK